MDIRKVTTPDERVWSILSSSLAFGGRNSMENIRKSVEENPVTSSDTDDWGCFTEDSRMMAHILNGHRFTTFDGHEVLTGCIGAVSTFPEYRESGAVRNIFEKIFRDAYDKGEVFSYLFPFYHNFYRKFCYETCCEIPVYRFPISALKGRHFTGEARLWLPGDDMSEHVALYSEFIRKYNLTHVRTVEVMKGRIYSDPFASRRYTYLLKNNENACAYFTFSDERKDGRHCIEVVDAAWLGKEGFDAILGFLSRYTADYEEIIIRMPTDVKLGALIPDGKALSLTAMNVYMARVINVQKALELLKKPEGCEFTIEVTDTQIPENNGIWRVAGDKAEKADAAADISVSVTALAAMVLGYISLDTAEYRDDVKVLSNRDTLAKIFIEKPLYLNTADHF